MARTKIDTSLISPITSALAMAGFKITGLADGTAGSDAATVGQLKVLQVKYNTQTSGTTTSSSTFQSTNLALSITPANVNNKVLVIAIGGVGITGNNDEVEASIFNTTQNYNVFSTHGQGYGYANTGTTISSMEWNCAMIALDSPATTSSNEYRVKLRSPQGHTVSWGSANSYMEAIVLIEVGA